MNTLGDKTIFNFLSMSLAIWNLDGFEPFDRFQIEPYRIKFLSHFHLLSIQKDKYEMSSTHSFFPSQLVSTRFMIPSTHYSSQSWKQSLLPYSINIQINNKNLNIIESRKLIFFATAASLLQLLWLLFGQSGSGWLILSYFLVT